MIKELVGMHQQHDTKQQHPPDVAAALIKLKRPSKRAWEEMVSQSATGGVPNPLAQVEGVVARVHRERGIVQEVTVWLAGNEADRREGKKRKLKHRPEDVIAAGNARTAAVLAARDEARITSEKTADKRTPSQNHRVVREAARYARKVDGKAGVSAMQEATGLTDKMIKAAKNAGRKEIAQSAWMMVRRDGSVNAAGWAAAGGVSMVEGTFDHVPFWAVAGTAISARANVLRLLVKRYGLSREYAAQTGVAPDPLSGASHKLWGTILPGYVGFNAVMEGFWYGGSTLGSAAVLGPKAAFLNDAMACAISAGALSAEMRKMKSELQVLGRDSDTGQPVLEEPKQRGRLKRAIAAAGVVFALATGVTGDGSRSAVEPQLRSTTISQSRENAQVSQPPK